MHQLLSQILAIVWGINPLFPLGYASGTNQA